MNRWRRRYAPIVAGIVGALVIAGHEGGVIGAGGGSVGNCKVSNYTDWALAGTDCTAGTTINITNDIINCAQAATAYGTPPIRFVFTFTALRPTTGRGIFNMNNGCQGDGDDDTIDFIIEAHGQDGVTGGTGGTDDSIKTRENPGPQHIQITGNFDCGAPPDSAHPDTVQFQHQGDRQIDIVNGTSGDWDAGTSTCQGAGGIIYTSGGGTHFLGGRYVLCNHAMNGTQSAIADNNTSINAGYRAGRTESTANGGDPNCQGFSGTGGCTATANLTVFSGNICENWSAATDTWVTDTNP